MRILIIANIPPYSKGGAENQAKLLAEEFVSLGNVVTVAGNEIPKNISINEFSFRTKHLATFLPGRIGRAICYFSSLAWFILNNKNNFDIIYCRFLGEAALSICVLKRFFGVRLPLIPCTACAGAMGDAAFVKSLPFSGYLVKLINTQCNAINNISPKIGEELRSMGVDSHLLTYLPNGVRIYDFDKKESLNKVRKLVYLGRLVPQKGLIFLFEAIECLIQNGEKLELHIIGEGPDREEMERYVCGNTLRDCVFFHGHIDNNLVLYELLNYDIFVLPSLYEGFATSTIEAMLVRLPVLVTISGGPDYFVDDSVGRLCEAGSSEALTTTINELINLDDDVLLEMGKRGRERVIQRFDIKLIAEKYIDLFNLVKNPPKSFLGEEL